MERPTLADVRRARERVSDAVHRTPLLGSRYLSERAGVSVRLKAEHVAYELRGGHS